MTNHVDPGKRTHHTYSLKDYFFAPLGCLLSISPYVVFSVGLVGLIIFLFIFYNVNVNPLGFGKLDFSSLHYESQFQKVTISNRTWTVSYEGNHLATFRGLIRHVSPIRDSQIPFLTHDILITNGDFSDPDKVKTSVINHRFQWFSPKISNPQGSINLLHTMPKSEESYQALLTLREGMQVSITGREILLIQLRGTDGVPIYMWQDAGCNSIFVTDVRIEP